MKKNTPTAKRGTATRRQRLLGDMLRDWMQQREIAAGERRAKKAPTTGGRGIDRVPSRLSGGNPLQRAPRTADQLTRQQRRNLDRTAAAEVQLGDQATPRYPVATGRRPRRRSLPGAEARRLERARKAWLAGSAR